jgi:hypothetical protein
MIDQRENANREQRWAQRHPILTALIVGVVLLTGTPLVIRYPLQALRADHGPSVGAASPSESVTAPVEVPTSTPPTESPSAVATEEPSPPPPVVSWSLRSRSLTAPARARFDYSARQLSAGQHVVLQRQMGTAATWGTVAKLPSSTGSALTPVMSSMGTWSFRVAVVDSAETVLASGQAAALEVSAKVPLGTLLDSSTDKSVVIDHHTFRYVYSPNLESFTYDIDGTRLFGSTSTRCRFIHLDLASSDGRFFTDSDYRPDAFEIVQQSADPRSVTIAPDRAGTLEATLRPGQSWALSISGSYYAYLNGYAICSAAETFE